LKPTTPTAAVPDTGAGAAPMGWAATQTALYDAAPAAASISREAQVRAPDTAPALNPLVWSGRKTAIAAALACRASRVRLPPDCPASPR
jgi:hypothetical protein